MRRALYATFAAAAVALAAGASAQVDPRKGVEQKVDFAGMLVTRSPLVARINASSNEHAREFLRQGTEHHQMAVTALKVGDLEGAEREANQAILAIGKARQLVPDDARRNGELRVRYQEKSRSVETLVASYERNRHASKQPASAEWTETLRLLELSRTLSASERMVEAIALLEEVQQRMLSQTTALLGNTVDYTMRFDNPAQEYEHEMARYRSLVDLVPTAMAELRPMQEMRTQAEQHLERGRRLSAAAQQLAGNGRPEDATVSIREAIVEVQSALAATGLSIPQEKR